MPAQWPIFINKVSTKLSSLSASSIDEFAVFLANEYFNSVKTSQTIFGNIHQPGKKSVLEEGFKKAFNKIYNEESIEFESKFSDSKYADLFEKAPAPNINFDTYCELEKWTEKNKDNLEKFIFYPFFQSTCPIEEPSILNGEIDFNLLEETSKPGEPEKYITMSISGFTEGIDYKFLYSINGEDQPIQIASDDVLNVLAPITEGTYIYNFKAVYGPDDILLKEINKSITLEIKSSGFEVIDEIKDPFTSKEQRVSIPRMTEEERINNIAMRVVYQNDGSDSYREWVDRLDIGYEKGFGKKVQTRVFELLGVKDGDYKKIKALPTGQINPINNYIFQEEHIDDKAKIPEWLTAADICKFVYFKSIDKKMDGYGDSKVSIQSILSKLDPKRFEKEEVKRNKRKIDEYLKEKNKWYDLLRKWGNSMTGNTEEESYSGDGYDVMAQAIIDYWKSCSIQPFKPGPPISPCTSIPPLGGKYTPISYGNKKSLANDLRRAWNTGKKFKRQPLTPVASKAVASAVSVSCAKHLLSVKFLYLGGFIVPTGPPIPMVGISPTTF